MTIEQTSGTLWRIYLTVITGMVMATAVFAADVPNDEAALEKQQRLHQLQDKVWDSITVGHNSEKHRFTTDSELGFYLAKHPDIKKLTIFSGDFPRISPIEEALSGLQYLYCPEIRKLPKLPNQLTFLTIDVGNDFQVLPDLPDSLQELFLSGPALRTLPPLPARLELLQLGSCTQLNELPTLPSSLTTFSFYGGAASAGGPITRLPTLPNALSHLTLCDVNAEISGLQLPASLVSLNINNGSRKLKQLPSLPNSLKKLRVDGCESLVSLPSLPTSLTHLSVLRCGHLEELPDLPQALTVLSLFHCYALCKLPTLPPSLEELSIHGCPNIKEPIPTIPPSKRKTLTPLSHRLPENICRPEQNRYPGFLCVFMIEPPVLDNRSKQPNRLAPRRYFD